MATAPSSVETIGNLPAGELKLAKALRKRIMASSLPGEAELSKTHLDSAALFLFETARERKRGQAAISIRTGLGDRRVTRIAVVNKDMPFLVDSISATVAAHGLSIDLLVHPVTPARRDEAGQLVALPEQGSEGDKLESMIYLETERIDARLRRTLERELQATLADVRAAVSDWPKMRELLQSDAERVPDAERSELLRWFAGGMLTVLGHVTVTPEGARSQVLGICRKSARELLSEDTYARAFAWFAKAANRARAPLIIKSNTQARVHRRVPLDIFIVPLIEDGKVAALSVHAGMWTSAALASPPSKVPGLRRQADAILESFGFPEGSHDAKALIHALTILPHDLAVGFDNDGLTRIAAIMMGLADRPRPRAAIVMAPLRRHVFAFVWLPRDMISTTTRLKIQTMIEDATGADTLDWSLLTEGGNLAMLRYVLDFRGRSREPDMELVDVRLQELLRGWGDAVEAALMDTEEPARAAALAARYAESFPLSYRTDYGPVEAARDIERIRALSTADADKPLRRDARLYRQDGDPADHLRMKLYQVGAPIALSDAVPALENFGFRVLAERSTTISGHEDGSIHDFVLDLPDDEEASPLLDRAGEIEGAIRAVLNARAEDDVFNRLVVNPGLSAQEADWLRAFYRYLRQANIAFTIYTVVDALRCAPAVTCALVELFRVRHDPGFSGDRDAGAERAEDAIRTGLADVAAINDDRLLRLYWALVGAILRTNAFAPAADEALAFKLDSSLVPGLPKPVPWREIFVYSRRVEGIHLRAGPVARGGLRWSDRRDDFRTEVLGLMKAQRVKNAVIVPTGAKGGFYPKRLPNPAVDREGWANEGRESYKIFIRSLLSITDNIAGGKTVHPRNVVIRDGADPYFVVAADKGTASFSDMANAIAADFDFWLGDAFASGGSKGYDHKEMGITARGAWISVQRHFLELGVDVQTEPVRVAGCGDMSGDVFGNGMMLSKAIKLVAAFDHRHVFIDPDPDPAKSWAERERLFKLPRSSWADYDVKLLSKGGGIFPRTLKRIPLSREAQAALGIEAAELDPESLINAILKGPVDLIWFGGIGTYIKASHETNAQVGDPSNDALRVNGNELRARVVGEGANLGVTQAGRIEFALRGGRINTDFIDNSAGVDCSDNEVNIKIALEAAKRSGDLTEKRRVALLESMTEEVAALVLEDNRVQTLALSIAEQGGANAVPSLTRLIETLEHTGELDRQTEGLADNQTLARRAMDGQGLTRPELAVLLSNTKLALQAAIEQSDVAVDEAVEPLLRGDFPELMHKPFRKYILGHQLRNEIVATVIANRIINRMGLIHPFELAEEEGATLAQVAAAFVSACELLGLNALWAQIDAEAMPERARLLLFEKAALALRGHIADLLRADGGTLSPTALIEIVSGEVTELVDHVDDLLAREARDHALAIITELLDAGAPEPLARKVAKLFAVDGTIGLARLSRDTGIRPIPLTQAFVDMGERLGLDWAQSKAAVMNPSDPWERLLVAGLARDFQQMRFDFLRHHSTGGKKADPVRLVEEWSSAREPAIEQFRTMISRARSAAPLTSAMLAQIASQARNLLNR